MEELIWDLLGSIPGWLILPGNRGGSGHDWVGGRLCDILAQPCPRASSLEPALHILWVTTGVCVWEGDGLLYFWGNFTQIQFMAMRPLLHPHNAKGVDPGHTSAI